MSEWTIDVNRECFLQLDIYIMLVCSHFSPALAFAILHKFITSHYPQNIIKSCF